MEKKEQGHVLFRAAQHTGHLVISGLNGVAKSTFQVRSIVTVSLCIDLFYNRPFSTIRWDMQHPCSPLDVGNCRECTNISLLCFVLSLLVNRNEHSAHCAAVQLWMITAFTYRCVVKVYGLLRLD